MKADLIRQSDKLTSDIVNLKLKAQGRKPLN
jgi:hypothetical protein